MLLRCVNVFVENANILQKVPFPKLCLPIIVLVSHTLNYTIVMTLFLGFLLTIGAFPGWIILSALPVIILQMTFTISAGIFLATVNVFYRDVHQMVQVALQFWFWLTPIVYFPTILPKFIQPLLGWNPMYFYVISY